MVSAQCSPIALFARSRFRVEIHDHAEYQDDQPEQRAEHDQYAHARIPFAQTVLADTYDLPVLATTENAASL